MRLKVSKLLSNLSQYLRYKATYYEMSHYVYKAEIKHECVDYLKPIASHNRNIGKSYALVKLALDYDLLIAVPLRSSGDYLQQIARDRFNSNELKIVVANENGKGRRYKTGLVEEGLTDNQLDCLIRPMFGNIIGYKSR